MLATYGWESQCHTRREIWPVLDEQGWISESFGEAVRLADMSNAQRTGRGETGRLSSVGSTPLSFIKEETIRSEQNGNVEAQCRGAGDSCSVLYRGGKLELVSGEGHVFSPTSVHSESSDDFVGVPRSRTLPNESADFQRYQSLPARSVSERYVHKRGLPLSQPPRPLGQQSSSMDTNVVMPEAIAIRVEGVVTEGNSGQEGGVTSEGDSSRAFHTTDTCEVVPSPVIRLRTYSEDEQASPELSSSKGKEPMFRIGSASGSSSSGGQKEDRSSSDSSQRSKGRADSFNTDSTTSGVSSCESGNLPGVVATLSSLSPIPSTSSINTLSTSNPTARSHIAPISSTCGGDAQDAVHPSTAHRKRWNLTRIPSFHRQSASPALGSLQSLPGSHSNFFTTHQDVLGYATLRNIRRKRTYSADADPDSGNGHSGGGEPRITRTVSVESDSSLDSNIWLRSVLQANCVRNLFLSDSLSLSLSLSLVSLSLPFCLSLPLSAFLFLSPFCLTLCLSLPPFALIFSFLFLYVTILFVESGICHELLPAFYQQTCKQKLTRRKLNLGYPFFSTYLIHCLIGYYSIRRNVSSASLTDHDHQGQPLAPNLQTFKPLSLHNRFVGLAMPVDVNMMFEVRTLVIGTCPGCVGEV